MKFDEIIGWIMILGSSMGMIKLSVKPVPEYIPTWLEYLVTAIVMAQFIWAITLIRKNKRS